MAESNNSKICGICTENPSKYCCPRCDILYCSLDCYKCEKHSECSETFYRDCITGELASYEADNASKQKMIDILQRMHKEDPSYEDLDEEIDSDDGDDVELQSRLQGLDLNDADTVWNALTEDEKNDFRAMLTEGDVTSIMPQWEPWWMYRKEKKMVEDVGAKDEEEAIKKCPSVRTFPELSSLTKVEPSPSIKYNITNVLASYSFIMRYFNGEPDPVESVICLLDICDNLNLNTNYDDPAVSMEAVVQKCQQSDLIQTDSVSIDVMKYDTFLLLQGPSDDNRNFYCKAAFSDLHEMLTNAKTANKQPKEHKTKDEFTKTFPDHSVENLQSLNISKVKKCIKKIEFYLSYVQSCNMEFD